MKKIKSNARVKKSMKAFISGANSTFTAENAAEAIAEELKLDAKEIVPEIEKLLAGDDTLLETTAEGELREIYISRGKFYENAEFCISPTQDEIERGILFPGHRFCPFLNHEILPFKALLKPEDSESELKVKVFKDFKIKDLELYHSLLGKELMISYFILNDKTNADAFDSMKEHDAKLKMKVFDMKDFYRKHSFKLGDALLVGIENYDEGIFRFSILPGSEKQIHFTDIQIWVARLEDALMNVFDKFGPAIDIPSQLEQALIGDPNLLESVFISFGEFIKITRKICIKPFGLKETVLWRNEENPADSLGLNPEFTISTGSVESLEKILMDMKVALTPHDVEAFMRDELYHGRKSLEAVSERCFSERELVFRDEAQHVAFDNFMDELWEEVIEDYDRATDEVHGKLRAKALSLMEDQVAFMLSLDKMKLEPEQIPKEEMIAFSDISDVLSQLLDILNNAGNNIGADEAGKMMEMLDETFQTVAVIKSSVKSKIPGLE